MKIKKLNKLAFFLIIISFIASCGGGGGGGGGTDPVDTSSSDWDSMVWDQDDWG